MKNNQSIIGGHYARKLLAEAGKRGIAYAETNGLCLMLRERGRRKPTGGLLLCVHQVEADFTCGSRGKWRYALRPSQRERAERLIGAKLTLIVRQWHNERNRQAAVQKMHASLADLIENPAFTAWVEAQEKIVGDSRYDLLSVEQANAWAEAVFDWRSNPAAAFVQPISAP